MRRDGKRSEQEELKSDTGRKRDDEGHGCCDAEQLLQLCCSSVAALLQPLYPSVSRCGATRDSIASEEHTRLPAPLFSELIYSPLI